VNERRIDDSDLRQQLSRRAGPGAPVHLYESVLARIDATPSRRHFLGITLPTLPSLRAALGGVGVAAATLAIALLIAVPFTHQASSGNDAAVLSRSELASLLGSGSLKANEAFVAEATIHPAPDACPMNRWMTVGVIAGIDSQVCVMSNAVDGSLGGSDVSGIFAFRYIAPGVLGLLGSLDPTDPSAPAFGAGETWPIGRTILVSGWLGATNGNVDCSEEPTAGDPLLPSGDDCPYQDWLSTSATPTGLEKQVQAGGARILDGLGAIENRPVQGTYVVRSETGPCPSAKPQNSTGCSYWLVLARLADSRDSGPTPTAFESASRTPSSPDAPRTPNASETPVGAKLCAPEIIPTRMPVGASTDPTSRCNGTTQQRP
jgi:hypothetical protein